MDPNANLREQREIVARVLARTLPDGADYIQRARHNRQQADDTERLAQLVEALDEWLTKGGFLPADWTFGPTHNRAGRQ